MKWRKRRKRSGGNDGLGSRKVKVNEERESRSSEGGEVGVVRGNEKRESRLVMKGK